MVMNNVYIEIIRKAFQQKFAYRANSYINILGAIINLTIQVSLWTALMKNNKIVNGVSFDDMINYIIINTIILSLVQSNIGNKLSQRVRDGSIAIDFIRPINLKYYLICDDLGENVFRTVFSTLPICLLSIIFLQFQLPKNPMNLILFIPSIIGGMIIIYKINYILGMLAFWIEATWYIQWYLSALFTLFGGTFIPIWFYPKLLYNVSMMLPFSFISFKPISIYTGKLSLHASFQVILLQIFWIIILSVLEKAIWKRAQNKVVIQGG
jgi:ABC-2 type transport system permease protein